MVVGMGGGVTRARLHGRSPLAAIGSGPTPDQDAIDVATMRSGGSDMEQAGNEHVVLATVRVLAAMSTLWEAGPADSVLPRSAATGCRR